MRTITFNGTSSLDIPCFVGETGAFNAPKPGYKTVSVPGRNGDLIYSYDRYENVKPPYKLIIRASSKDEFRQRVDRVKSWLLPCYESYYRLEDSIDPDHYRMAQYAGPFDLDIGFFRVGAVDITFNCKPQRYLVSGETAVTVSADGTTITNPTAWAAKPLIRVYGSGTLSVGDTMYTIAEGATEYIDMDSEIENCYEGTVNRNGLVTRESGFPELAPGDTGISYSGSITQVTITPRFWEL